MVSPATSVSRSLRSVFAAEKPICIAPMAGLGHVDPLGGAQPVLTVIGSCVDYCRTRTATGIAVSSSSSQTGLPLPSSLNSDPALAMGHLQEVQTPLRIVSTSDAL